MTKKTDWTKSNGGFVLINLIAALVVVVIVVVTVILSLRHYTQHGKEVVVPSITNLYLEEASIVAASEGLKIEVIDSTYSNKTALGTIVEQNPKAGAKVKNGRTIYVIQNARFRRPIFLPELHDLSVRQAERTINGLGLKVAEIIYEPSMYKDIVLDVRQNDSSLVAGSRLEEGASLILVVGKGQGTAEVSVPSVIGKSLHDARSWLLGNMLTIGVVEYDSIPTEETRDAYVVFSQSPESGTVVVEGTSVNLKLSMDIEKTITADNEQSEEDFF